MARDNPEDVRIGVVGGEDIVQRVMAIARRNPHRSWRLVGSVFDAESEAHARALKIANQVDVVLFGGPLPYDIATSRGDLPVPASFVPVGGASLYSALLRAKIENTFDLERITIDSAALDDVDAAYDEVGLDRGGVRVQPYDGPEAAAQFLDFHRDHYRSGSSTGAMTTVPSVAAALVEAGIPSMFMRATPTTVRHALNTAALMGSGARLEESRIVTILVRLPRQVIPEHSSPSNYWFAELKLLLHRELLHEARSMDATVLPSDGHGFLVITTMGSLTAATDDLQIAPFIGRVSTELGVALEVGIGLGRSTREAELNAQTAVGKSAATAGAVAYLVGPHDTVLELTSERQDDREGDLQSVASTGSGDSRPVSTLRRLAEQLDARGDRERVVDAVTVSELLGVTLRTARRTLHDLVDAGLAWPMPPTRAGKAGRPARPYQLLTEKLPD